ncbi:MAG: carbohydrate kinase family protein [Patescibacteria group bacterium]|jgi:sugar/nucleoside kinase (ribokinase family)
MYDVITIGSAFQDVYVFSKKFKVSSNEESATGEMECFAFGTKIELDDILFEIGGGATNNAYTLKNLGFKVGCLSRVGQDGAGLEVINFLKKNNIGNLLVIDKKLPTARSVVFLAKNGERTILVYRGAAHNFSLRDIDFSKLKKTRWLYITSLAGSLAVLEKIIVFAHNNGIKVVLNPGKLEIQKGKGRLSKIFRFADVLILNHEEAMIVKKNINPISLIKDLGKLCPNLVIITEGNKGSWLKNKESLYRINIKPVKAADTTGAGDAFGSGFLAGYIKFRGDIKKAIVLACNNSSSVVKKIGAKHGLLPKNAKLNYKNISFRQLS